MKPETASFRDPAGRIFHLDDLVFRTISKEALPQFKIIQENLALRKLIQDDKVVQTLNVDEQKAPAEIVNVGKIIEYPRLPFISFPYEWSFSLLKAAAIHHLDLQITLLPTGVS